MKRTAKRAAAVASFWGKSQQERDWYAIKAADDNGVAEIRIYDVIGWPFVEADAFLADLSRLQADTIKIKINSPGGDVFEGTTIYNALADHRARIITSVEGLAASMASIIALAGDERHIYRNAQYMIHNPWTIAAGDYNDFLKEAELLKSIGSQMAETYAEKTGKKQADIQSWMDTETWFTGEKAVEQGFMTKALTAGSASARFDLSMFAHAPGGQQPTQKDLERTLTRDAGLTRQQARALLQGGFDAIGMSDSADDEQLGALDRLIHSLRNNDDSTC